MSEKQVSAWATDGVADFTIIPEARVVVANFRGEPPVPVAVPYERLAETIGAFIGVMNAATPRARMQPGQTETFTTDWWELMPATDGSYVLGLRIPGAGLIHFQLDRSMISGLYEYLRSQAEPDTAQRPDEAPIS